MSAALTDAELELRRVRSLLVQAELTETPVERWLTAYAAVLRVAAMVLKVSGAAYAVKGRVNAWQLLGRVAPGLAEWARYFYALQAKREVVVAGAAALVSVREADDLVRDVGLFCDTVQRRVATSGPGPAWAARSCRMRC